MTPESLPELVAEWTSRADALDARMKPVTQWNTHDFSCAGAADTLHACARELRAAIAATHDHPSPLRLPELPEPCRRVEVLEHDGEVMVHVPRETGESYYTSDQMRSYAQESIALSRGEGRAVACYRVHDQFGADRWYDGLPTKAVLQNAWREQSRIEYAYTHPAQGNAAIEAMGAGGGGYTQQVYALARRCLWLAFAWNDHNFDAAHIEARREAKRLGIDSPEYADEWLEREKQIATTPQPTAAHEPVAFRYLAQLGTNSYSWTRWREIEELHHYGPDGNLVKGPSPDWRKVEYAYAHAQEQGAAVDGESFICYLIDNCERETISEESLHSWLAAFLKNPRYHNPAALAQTGEKGS